MKLSNEHVRLEDVALAKEILKGQWCGFVRTELFVTITYEPGVEAICEKFNIEVQKYIRRVVYVAMREITNSKNWPEWVAGF